jgi:AAA15 family ATPase/GTPase
MKLISLRVTNYKNVYDSTEFKIDDVTCLVGQNEAGKTAILQSLTKLNPIAGTEEPFKELDFPRKSYYDYNDGNRPENVLTTQWELETGDIVALEEKLGKDSISSKVITLKKGYKNEFSWDIKIDYKIIIDRFIEDAGLFAEEKEKFTRVETTTDFIAAINKITPKSERETKLLAAITEKIPGGATAAAKNILATRLPLFLYFPIYDLMKGSVSVNQIITDKSQSKLSMGDKIFLSLLEMADASVEQIQALSKFEILVGKLEAISNKLTSEIFEYWSQNKHLSVDFRFDSARPDDPAPYNSGYVFRTRIKNNRHGVTVPFDERSTGFVWFFSFLVWFSQVKKNYGTNLIILLDEPGLSLHAKAQSDLLRYFAEKLIPNYQLIYSTHSPFMIDPNNLMSVRTVEDAMNGEDILGTKVSGEILTTNKDTLFPLQAALGYDIAQTLFIGEHVILVEGPSDILYLKWASDLLKTRKRKFLDNRWVITPAGSIDKIASFITLFSGKGIHIAALTDFAKGDKKKIENLRKIEVLKSGHVLTIDVYAEQEEADVEDILGRKLYSILIDACYSLPAIQKVPETKTSNAPIRVVKEIEGFFAVMPPEAPNFDHYHPSVYLIEHSNLFEGRPELEVALNRFEKIFIDLNVLLSQK